jgi:CRISPR-associated endonuclease Cas1
MIIKNKCKIYKKKLEIVIGYYDLNKNEKKNVYYNPKDLKGKNILLTKDSSISTSIFKLQPDLSISVFDYKKKCITHTLMSLDNISEILKNEKYFYMLNSYKRKKLAYIFCKGVCTDRIKILFDLNRVRKNKKIIELLKQMRLINAKLIKSKDKKELMGYEGNIAKSFYYGLSIIDKRWNKVRDTKSKDIINILMNFAHTIIRNRILLKMIEKGINPNQGFLHDNERNETFLVFDFAELWIAYIDKLIFYAIERKIIHEEDIKEDRLNDKAIENIITLINQRVTDEEIEKKLDEFLLYLKGVKKRLSWKTD